MYEDVQGMRAHRAAISQQFDDLVDHRTLQRPASWGGWRIAPHSIEFNNLAEYKEPCRIKYVKQENGEWKKLLLSE